MVCGLCVYACLSVSGHETRDQSRQALVVGIIVALYHEPFRFQVFLMLWNSLMGINSSLKSYQQNPLTTESFLEGLINLKFVLVKPLLLIFWFDSNFIRIKITIHIIYLNKKCYISIIISYFYFFLYWAYKNFLVSIFSIEQTLGLSMAFWF